MKMIEATMTNKINQINHKIELQEKERQLENGKIVQVFAMLCKMR